MAKVRRNRLLAVMIALAFVIVQFVDLAVLDNQHAAAAEVHSDLSGNLAGHEAEGTSSCGGHCAGHVPHHVFASDSSAYEPIAMPGLTRRFIVNARYTNLSSLPPVPPPIS